MLEDEWNSCKPKIIPLFSSGDYDRRSTDGDERVYRAVQAFHHPQWDPSRLNNDVALIELDRPAVFDEHVQPICLPSLGEELPTGSSCYITGMHHFLLSYQKPLSTHALIGSCMLPTSDFKP